MKTKFLLFLGIYSLFATEQSADINSNIFFNESVQEGNLKNINDYINKEDGNKKKRVSISHIKGNCNILFFLNNLQVTIFSYNISLNSLYKGFLMKVTL